MRSCAALLWCASHASALSRDASSFASFLSEQQALIVAEIEALDGGATFCADAWERDDGSSGLTRVIAGGDVVEKGCVSCSYVRGVLTPERAAAMSARGRGGVDPGGGQRFVASALSLVLHARSPNVPTLRGDARRFVVLDEDGAPAAAWFGGGCDLTPCRLYDADAAAFHAYWRDAVEAVAPGGYAAMKAACDTYFYLPLRREHRGVGGIFFDDRAGDGAEALARATIAGMIASWRPIVEKRRSERYGDDDRAWQLERRGRYLEFNLLNDRGVKFGLSPDAIERIMVSAPPLISWTYRKEPANDDQARLLEVLREPRDWV
jgi:coproporphyrinogen III oxidase